MLPPLSNDPVLLRRGFQADNQAQDAVEQMVFLLDLQDADPGIERLRRWALEISDPKPGMSVVDVGSGTGTMVRRMAALVGPSGSVTGVEPNPKLRDIAAGRAEGLSVTFVDGVAGALPLPDGSVDLLWCERVLQHVADAQAAVQEFARVLRPGGAAVILDSDHASRVTSDVDLDIEATIIARFLSQWPNSRAARSLPRQISAAGLLLHPDIGSSALVLRGPIALAWFRVTATAAVADGALTPEQADAAAARFAAAAEDGVAFSAVTVFGFVSWKPASPIVAGGAL